MHPLKAYLTKRRISQRDFAAKIGVNESAVSRQITQNRLPEPEVMQRIIDVTKGQVTANDWFIIPNRSARRSSLGAAGQRRR